MKLPERKKKLLNHSSDIQFKDFIKFYKDFTKKLFSFLVNNTNLPSDNPLRFGKTYGKITASKKIKTMYNKIEQTKAQ